MSMPNDFFNNGGMPSAQSQPFSQMPQMDQNTYGYRGYGNNIGYGQPQSNMNAQNNYSSHRNMIPGRMINAETDVQFNEIPMDRTFATFITNDLKSVYLKTVGGDGKVYTNEYILKDLPDQENAQNPLDMILERLDRIEASLSPTSKEKSTTSPYRKEKKENEQ